MDRGRVGSDAGVDIELLLVIGIMVLRDDVMDGADHQLVQRQFLEQVRVRNVIAVCFPKLRQVPASFGSDGDGDVILEQRFPDEPMQEGGEEEG